MSAPAASAELYRLKSINFFGREVPIVMQNDNGPCPLLAISNLLLLRNQIQLPLGAPDVSQVIAGSPSSVYSNLSCIRSLVLGLTSVLRAGPAHFCSGRVSAGL